MSQELAHLAPIPPSLRTTLKNGGDADRDSLLQALTEVAEAESHLVGTLSRVRPDAYTTIYECQSLADTAQGCVARMKAQGERP